MIIARIKGANRECGKSQGYMGLPIRDMVIIDKTTGYYSPAMETAWTATPDELDRLNKGANIIVRIMGQVPPPMLLTVDTELPAMPVVERKPVAWRWRNILGDGERWTYAADKPDNHPQYITEPLYSD